MPIKLSLEIPSIGDNEFAEVDKVVMACAYATHNHLGRFFDEKIYENDLAARLRSEGLLVNMQVPIAISHARFEKRYYLDLVVNQMVYELKAVGALNGEHDAQALNYAMLQDVRLVKLINFGEASVRGKLLRNAVNAKNRHQPTIDTTDFKSFGSACDGLIEYLGSLIRDWGTHLSCRLYNEAMVHQYGGEATCLQRIEISSASGLLGTHLVQMYDQYRAFVITGFSMPQDGYRLHSRILLHYAKELESIQWLNLNKSRLEVITIADKHA
jgi:GxxExxY protein